MINSIIIYAILLFINCIDETKVSNSESEHSVKQINLEGPILKLGNYINYIHFDCFTK